MYTKAENATTQRPNERVHAKRIGLMRITETNLVDGGVVAGEMATIFIDCTANIPSIRFIRLCGKTVKIRRRQVIVRCNELRTVLTKMSAKLDIGFSYGVVYGFHLLDETYDLHWYRHYSIILWRLKLYYGLV